jgi:hypothetical protein
MIRTKVKRNFLYFLGFQFKGNEGNKGTCVRKIHLLTEPTQRFIIPAVRL